MGFSTTITGCIPAMCALPPAPWTFQASRIQYQLRSIPTAVARDNIPALDTEDTPLRLLSLSGKTLGGIFCVEYESSPVGPYKEIAVLAGLVGRPFELGAWASHIFVDSIEAAEAGRQLWGLPATVVPIDFDCTTNQNIVSVLFGDNELQVSGWSKSDHSGASWTSALDIALPSFSGCLSPSDSLLRYSLRIASPKSLGVNFNPNNKDYVEYNTLERNSRLRSILQKSQCLCSIDVGSVTLTAGVPDTL